jgi:LCP family protein required for cell wall assembly
MKSNSNLPLEMKTPRRRRARKRWALALGTTVGALVAGGAFLAVSGAGYMYAVSPTVRSVFRAVTHRDEITPDRAFPGQDALTLLLVGADQDRDNYKRVTGKAQRSDTLIVARFDFQNNKAALVSIPRDTKIRIPGYRGYQKVNAAFAYGGPDLAKKTVEQFLGVTIDHTLMVNFDGFKKVVDLMGGVPVTVDKPLNYDDNWGDLHVHLDPGDHWLNGEQALGFVRIRKVDSDIHRAARQQQFLQALRGRLKDPRVWLKTPAIIEGARKSLQSDLDDNQILCLGTFVKGLPAEAVQTVTLPGDEGPSFVTLDPEGVRKIATDLLAVENPPLEGLGGRGDRDRVRLARRGERGLLESDAWREQPRKSRRPKGSHKAVESPAQATENAADDTSPTTDEFSAPLNDRSNAATDGTKTDGPVTVREVDTTDPSASSTEKPRSEKPRHSRRRHTATPDTSSPSAKPSSPAPDSAPPVQESPAPAPSEPASTTEPPA